MGLHHTLFPGVAEAAIIAARHRSGQVAAFPSSRAPRPERLLHRPSATAARVPPRPARHRDAGHANRECPPGDEATADDRTHLPRELLARDSFGEPDCWQARAIAMPPRQSPARLPSRRLPWRYRPSAVKAWRRALSGRRASELPEANTSLATWAKTLGSRPLRAPNQPSRWLPLAQANQASARSSSGVLG